MIGNPSGIRQYGPDYIRPARTVLDAVPQWTSPSPSPLASLPPELLTEVYRIFCDVHSDDSWRSLFVIAHVCRYWREVALKAPVLWRDLTLDQSVPREVVLTQLKRAQSVPLHVRIDLPDTNRRHVRSLVPQLPRVHNLHITRLSSSDISYSRTYDTPALRELAVTVRAMHGWDEIPLVAVDQSLESLESVHFVGVAYSVLTPFLRPALRVLHVHLDDSYFLGLNADRYVSPSRLLYALQDMPLLEDLFIDSFLRLHDFSTEVLPDVTLPHLQEFHIRSNGEGCTDVLDHLILPARALFTRSIRSRIVGGPTANSEVSVNNLAYLERDAFPVLLGAVVRKLAGHGVLDPHSIPSVEELFVVLSGNKIINVDFKHTLEDPPFLGYDHGNVPGLSMGEAMDQICANAGEELFKNVSLLVLITDVNPSPAPLAFGPFFRCFPGLEILALASCPDILESFLIAATTDRPLDATCPLPNLKALWIGNVAFRWRPLMEHEEEQFKDDPSPMVLKLKAWLRKRREMGAPLLLVDLSHCYNVSNFEVEALYKDGTGAEAVRWDRLKQCNMMAGTQV
ncbi:hypothetical protein EIP91_003162 [Steccherinum ochraceum]|uniref:Uncharacterized protein n=1 Tax=Steccherinum ochraceum TaxID=92696 RepID=A0A4R0RZC4_9APHY|nr:hypothetical protein EIP91_003162 [Steccherinum ochraceum]